MEYLHRFFSPLGEILAASDGEALTGLWFRGQKHCPDPAAGGYAEGELPVFALADRWLEVYFSGRAPDFTPPLVLAGTPFRRAVWEALGTVPYGQTVTYGQLARLVTGSSASSRAVGAALGLNPISLMVPCHRVVGADGSLTGYAGGLERKARLLALEKAAMGRL